MVHFAVKLLSPPVPPEFSGPGSHLVAYMSMLNVILFGLSSSDIVHVLSLYGVVSNLFSAKLQYSVFISFIDIQSAFVFNASSCNFNLPLL